MSVQDEFAQIPDELKEKVVKKINKTYRWIEHQGGFNEIWLYVFSMITFKMYEDMGLEVSMSPRADLDTVEEIPDENTHPRIVLTDL